MDNELHRDVIAILEGNNPGHAIAVIAQLLIEKKVVTKEELAVSLKLLTGKKS